MNHLEIISLSLVVRGQFMWAAYGGVIYNQEECK